MNTRDNLMASRATDAGASSVQFGLFNLMSYRDHPDGIAGVVADTRSMVLLAEEIGLDVAWFAEHHFTNYSISVSPLVMMAHMASATTRIRLGSAVIVLPLYQPMRVAQEIALVDQLSGGRVVLGIGTGYQPFEFARYGVDVDARGDTFLKYWDVIEEALTTGTVSEAAQALGLPATPCCCVLCRSHCRRSSSHRATRPFSGVSRRSAPPCSSPPAGAAPTRWWGSAGRCGKAGRRRGSTLRRCRSAFSNMSTSPTAGTRR